MNGVNKVILVGNVGADPELRKTTDGRYVANLRVATSDSWKDKQTGERKERTEWHRVTVFNDGLCLVVEKYVHKGSKVYVEGQLQTRKWTDKNNIERYSTEVVLQAFNGRLVLLSPKPQSASQGYEQERGDDAQRAHSIKDQLEDEITF